MSGKVQNLPRQADPNIDEVLEAFLNGQRTRLAARTVSDYRAVVQLLQSYLNGYAYQGMT